MKSLICLVALLALAMPAIAQTNIPNPQYKHWAKFKPGTKNVSKGAMALAGRNLTIETSTTLKEVKPDQLTIEIATTMTEGEQKHPTRSRMETVKAEYTPDGQEIKIEKTATETIEALGKKINCDVYQLHVPQLEGQSEMKMWVNEGVPGAVKTEVRIKGPQGEITRNIVVQSVEVK